MNKENISACIQEAITALRLSGTSLKESLSNFLARPDAGAGRDDSIRLIKRELRASYQNISEYEPPADVIRLIPAESANHYCIMPLDINGRNLKTAMTDPTDMDIMMDLHLISGMKIVPVLAERDDILDMISRYYRTGGGGTRISTYRVRQNMQKTSGAGRKPGASILSADSPVVRMVNDIISEAINAGASDIHMEPFEREMRVRFRQDGILQIHQTVNTRYINEVVSRIKIMSNMDIAEKRRPQDGRIRVEGGDKAVDMRISTLPTEHGEKIVMRILDKGAVALDLSAIGLDKKKLEFLEDAIRLPYGMILVTGPTGSGKTTTLYSALSRIKSPTLNISTIEDPIEYKIDGITQTAVRTDLNLTFANALRTLLRQDPNVIMVGEIRDEETAQMAIRAALTGHLVFSTLHTNDAPSAVTRLLDMGMEPFLAASSLSLIMAQRLVRRVCQNCAESAEAPANVTKLLGIEPGAGFMKGKGCPQCNYSGYKGRIGLFEMMPVSETIRNLTNQRADAGRIREAAEKEGMINLRQDGIIKAKAGITTPEEVLRETT